MSGPSWMPARRETVGELRPDAGGAVETDDLAVLVDALLLEDEDVLGGHHVLFHADDLGDAGGPCGCRRYSRERWITTSSADAM